MSSDRTPPALANWLLSRLFDAYRRDGLIGDLEEEYRRGRSRAWYWREVLTAVAASRRGRPMRHLAFRALRVLMIAGVLMAAGFHWAWPLFICALDPSWYFWLSHRRRVRLRTLERWDR